MNLKEFLTKYNRVQVPALQRDYAQGRKSQESIANEFLDAIFSVLESQPNDKKSLHIDFIYGYKESDIFLLIDGQQRITTLWLLHFYIYRKADIKECEFLGHFSYAVRKSSKNFCSKLLSQDFDLNIKPSEAIRANEGVFESRENLNNDPTIKAMLNMLDLIYERIKTKRNIEKLANNLDSITFNEFNMGEFNLGEELYIKMNARGKQLSKYENLKSFIEKGKGFARNKEILAKIDNDWSDYFFNNDLNSFDEKGLNFLHYANLFFKLESQKISESELKEIIDNSKRVVDEFYEPLQDIENIRLLDNFIQICILYKELDLLKMRDSAFFKGENMSYTDICYFFALLHYVKNVENLENIQSLKDYLRVCRNLIENYRDDNVSFVNVFFDRFKELAKGSDDIYRFLCNFESKTFNQILDLEIRKAELIVKFRDKECEDDWEDILDKTSDNEVLVGRVDFLLDFSDENFSYKKYNFFNKPNYRNPNFDKFHQYAKLTMQILDKKHFLNANLALFQRAFLSVGNYGFYATNYFYGNVPMNTYRDREAMNWLLSGVRVEMPYFVKLLDLLLEQVSQKDLASKMQNIINNCDLSSKEWWEQLLIKQVGLFEVLNKKETFQRYPRIRVYSSNNHRCKIELLPNLRGEKNVKDLLLYGFYLYLKDIDFELGKYNDEYYWWNSFDMGAKQCKSDIDDSGVKIKIDEKEFPININNDIFKEFDKIINYIKENQ